MRIIFDASASPSSRRLDDNGFLHVSACPITSFGVFDYARAEAELPGDPNEIVKVLRAKEVISSAEFIASCQNLPIVNNHTYIEGVTVDAEPGEEDGMDPDKKGVNGAMTNVRFDEASGWVVADLVFYSRTMIRLILSNKKVELSLGYTCKFVPLEGQAEAAEQTDMSGNHLALVDRARVPGARVLDSAFPDASLEGNEMPKPVVVKKKTMDADALSALREALLPALTAFLEGQGGGGEPAADPAVDPAVDPAEELSPEEQAAKKAAEEAAAAEAAVDPAEPTGDEGEEAGAVSALIKQLIDVLNGGASDPAVGDEGNLDTDPVQKKLGDEDGEEQVANTPDKKGVTMDAVFMAVAKRDELYKRVSRVVGAFDCAAMSHDKVAKYGVKKLGIKCADGHEVTALDAYLLATDKAAVSVAKPKIVGDSMPSSSELDAYLAGK